MRKRLERHLDWNLAVSYSPPVPPFHPDVVITAVENQGVSNTRMAARLCGARAPSAVRGLRRSTGPKRGHRGALSA
jgi:hypothetical protein